MKKKLVKKIFMAQQYEGGAIETFLEKMAQQGYWFVKMQGIFFYFEPCEPRKVRFQVDYFDKASILDTNPEEETLEYIEYCKECGWEHIYSNGKMQIFRTENQEAPDIHTDDSIKLKYIMKNTLLTVASTWLLPLLFMVMNLVEVLAGTIREEDMSAYTYAYQMTNLTRFYVPVFMGIYTLYCVIHTVRIIKFYGKNKRRVKEGQNIIFYSYENVKKFGNFSIAYLIMLLSFCVLFIGSMTSSIWMLFLLLAEMGIIVGAVNLTQHKRANRISNIMVVIGACAIMVPVSGIFLLFGLTFGFHDGSEHLVVDDVTYIYSVDELPFTLENLGVEPSEYEFLYEEKSKEVNKTPWASNISYWNTYISEEDTTLPFWSAEIFQSKYLRINEEYRRRWFTDSDYQIEALSKELVAEYEAEGGYKVKFLEDETEGLLLICGEKTIYITGNFEDTQENTELLKQLYQ